MTALAADKSYQQRAGDVIGYPVATAKKIYLGALCSLNSTGFAQPSTDAASTIFAGVSAQARVDNTSGADGALTVVLNRRGVYRLVFGGTATQADVGKKVYAVDDQTVDLVAATTNDVFVGIITAFESATLVWVDIEPAIHQA